jgi:hypothetical protein
MCDLGGIHVKSSAMSGPDRRLAPTFFFSCQIRAHPILLSCTMPQGWLATCTRRETQTPASPARQTPVAQMIETLEMLLVHTYILEQALCT